MSVRRILRAMRTQLTAFFNSTPKVRPRGFHEEMVMIPDQVVRMHHRVKPCVDLFQGSPERLGNIRHSEIWLCVPCRGSAHGNAHVDTQCGEVGA